MPGICALDLASTTGFAIEGQPPLLGSRYFHRSAPGKVGPQGLEFMTWLRHLLGHFKPGRVVYERPLPPRFQSSTATGTVTMGFAYAAEIVCAELHIPVTSISAATVRKYFTGTGRSDHKAKGRVIAECERRGWAPPDDNAADAAAILAWAINEYHPTDRARGAAIGNVVRLV